VRIDSTIELCNRLAYSGELRYDPGFAAIEDLVRFTQEGLAPLVGSRLLGDERRRWFRAHWAGVSALRELLGQRVAKHRHVELADGAPFAICRGHSHFTFPSIWGPHGPIAGERVHPAGAGCGLVFPDTLSGRGRYPFRFYCDDCARTSSDRSRRDRARLQAFVEGREVVVARFDEDGAHLLAWSGDCSSCGRPFLSRRPDSKRCDDCRSTRHR
jgi:hypothetical protein